MSDVSQGDGWWQATDGKWYPPEQAPGTTAAVPPGPAGADPIGASPAGAGADAAGDDGDGEGGGKGKLIAAILVVLLLIGAGVAAVILLTGDDDSDVASGPNTTAQPDIGDATGVLTDDGPIEFGTEYEDALEGSRTEARYTLEAPAGAMMTLTVSNDEASERGVFTTFESSGQRFVDLRVQPGSSETETVILSSEGAATFELIFTEGPAAYTFKVDLEVQDDAGEGGDAGEDFASAFEIEAGAQVDALLGGQDQTDHFTVELQPGTELSFEAAVDRSSERGVFFSVELEGDRLLTERVQPGADTAASLLLSDQDSGTLEIIATEGPANYTFTADFVEQEEGGEAGDASAELADARTVDTGSPIEGMVGGRDEGDYYLFTASSPTITVTASSDPTSERGFFVVLQDPSGSRVGSFRVQPGAEASETIEVDPGAEVRMIINEGPATYSLTVT